MEDLLHSRPQHHPEAAGRVIDGEAHVVTPWDGHLHTLDAVATWLWSHADGRRSVAELIQALQAAFDVDAGTAREDVLAFVEEALAKGILELPADAPR